MTGLSGLTDLQIYRFSAYFDILLFWDLIFWKPNNFGRPNNFLRPINLEGRLEANLGDLLSLSDLTLLILGLDFGLGLKLGLVYKKNNIALPEGEILVRSF